MYGKERRISRRLMEYWYALKKDLSLPREGDFVPADLEDIWEHCFTIVIDNPDSVERMRYQHIGPAISSVLDDAALGQCIFSALASPIEGDTASKMLRIAQTQQPLVEEAECLDVHGNKLKYRLCLLPFADNYGEMRYIIGGMRWIQKH
jgi:hypothetical protein